MRMDVRVQDVQSEQMVILLEEFLARLTDMRFLTEL
jgi:hypothetical protein